jgi:hypothetical protein
VKLGDPPSTVAAIFFLYKGDMNQDQIFGDHNVGKTMPSTPHLGMVYTTYSW